MFICLRDIILYEVGVFSKSVCRYEVGRALDCVRYLLLFGYVVFKYFFICGKFFKV